MDIRYLDAKAMAALVRAKGVAPFIRTLAGMIDEDYRRWGDFTKMERVAAHHPLGVTELMPVWDNHRFAFKYVNGHPANTAKNLLCVAAFGVLSDLETGYPVLIADMTVLTALRTAAASALVATYMARPESKTMAMIGNGAQAEFQILAFRELLGITHVRAYDIDPQATAKLIDNLKDVKGLTITACSGVVDAVRGSDIVTTCTAAKTDASIITPDMLAPGMHLNAIGGDTPGKTELHPDVLRAAQHVVVQYEPQTRHEGDIQRLPKDFPVTEFWRVATGAVQSRKADSDITIFDSVGFALEDFAALRCVHALAGKGETLQLFPTPANVKDLYGELLGR